jgi:polygalacturonase
MILPRSGGGGSITGWVDVKRYGAVGDGVTDDRAAIILALAAALTLGPGARLVFPPGLYYV